MKSFRGLLAALVAACAFLGASGASATAIPLNQWEEFGFGVVGSALVACPTCTAGDISVFAPDPPWTFTCATSCTLAVTDGFQSGDQFEFFDNLLSLGLTSAPTLGSDCGNAVLACLGNAAFSHGLFVLAPGAHSITGIASLSPFQSGAAFFIVRQAQVPEPSTILLLAMGLLAVGVMLRKRV